MFTRRRSGKMGDLSQLRREVEEILGKFAKDFEKSVDQFKCNEQIRQIVKKVHNISDKVKQDVGRKLENTKCDIAQVRKEIDGLLKKSSEDFKKEVEILKVSEHASDVKKKFSNLCENALKQINEKMDHFYVRDETVKIRIEVERLLTEISTEFEKQYEHVKENSHVKEMIRNFRKITEAINKEVGKSLEDFKQDRASVSKDVKETLKKISIEFEKTMKPVTDGKVKEMIQTAESMSSNVSLTVSNMMDDLQLKLSDFKLRDEISRVEKDVEKLVENLSVEFKGQAHHLQNHAQVREVKVQFEVVLEKVRSKISENFEGFKETKVVLQKDIEEEINKVHADLEKDMAYIRENEFVKESMKNIERFTKKASTDASNLLEGLKVKAEEFQKSEKSIQVRKDVEGILKRISTELEKEYEHIKDNLYVKETLNKLRIVQNKVRQDIEGTLEDINVDREKARNQISKIFSEMSEAFEKSVKNIQENEYVKEIVTKVNSISSKVSSDVSKILEKLKANESVKEIVKKMEQGADTVTDSVKTLSEGSQKTLENVKEFVESGYEKLRDFEPEEFKKIKEESEKIIDYAKKAVQVPLSPNGQKTGYPMAEITQREAKIAGLGPAISRLLLTIWRIAYPLFWFFMFVLTSIPAAIYSLVCLVHPKDVKDNVIVITGAGNGLGKALAKRFIWLGAKVACVDINTADNESSAEELRKEAKSPNYVKTYTCDVSKPDNAKKLADDICKDFGKVDILVNNAGIVCSHKITEGTDSAIQRVIEVNLNSNFWMVRAFLPKMSQQRQGHIVFINSESGIHGLPMASSYAATKSGLLGLAYSLEGELRRDPALKNIKVSSVHPIYFASRPTMANHMNLKSEMMTVDSVADLTMHGIRRELFVFCIPFVYGGFLLSSLLRLLPPRLYDSFIQAFVGGVKASASPAFRDPTAKQKTT